MAETFAAYRTRVLSYLGDEEPIGVQQSTPSQLDRRLRDVAPEELIRRPAPEKWSIAFCRKGLLDSHLARVTGGDPPFAGIDALGASTASPQVCSFGTKL
jgi:hypothetical protein